MIYIVCELDVFVLQVFDNYAVTVMIGGEPYTLGLFDTAGNVVFGFLYTRHESDLILVSIIVI